MIVLICDGSSKGNPGPASIGVVVWDRTFNPRISTPTHTWCKSIGVKTNMQAEWEALLSALKYCREKQWHNEEVYLFTDAQTIVKQANEEWKVKHENVTGLYYKFKALKGAFKKLHVYWVPRQLTTLADALAQKKEV